MNKKNRLKDFKNLIKSFFKKIYLLVILLIFLLIFILTYFINPEIKKDVLFWFFSSITQSMAALFAVVGMFAVFRFQNLQELVTHETKTLRNILDEVEFETHFPLATRARTITDNELIISLDKILDKDEKGGLDERAFNNIYVYVTVIKKNMSVRDYTKNYAMIPMIAILFTFILSSISLLFVSSYFCLSGSINEMGVFAISFTFLSVIISMVSILRYFLISF